MSKSEKDLTGRNGPETEWEVVLLPAGPDNPAERLGVVASVLEGSNQHVVLKDRNGKQVFASSSVWFVRRADAAADPVPAEADNAK